MSTWQRADIKMLLLYRNHMKDLSHILAHQQYIVTARLRAILCNKERKCINKGSPFVTLH